MSPGDKGYLGDGVYWEFDGYGFWLTTGSHDSLERIYMEPDMIQKLLNLTND